MHSLGDMYLTDGPVERIRLLVHILKMVIEPPHKQCPTVQKMGLNVRKLEEATTEAMSIWFNDADHPENLLKKPFLKEIFKVAKAQERYKNGEIGELENYFARFCHNSDLVNYQTGTLAFLLCTVTEVDKTTLTMKLKKWSKTTTMNLTALRSLRIYRLQIATSPLP